MRIGRRVRAWGADELQPAVGWKIWRVDHRPEQTRLRSVLYGDLWSTGSPLEATCRRLLRSPHEAPCPGCGCGIHAGRELSAWEHYLGVEPDTRVFGRVLLWGATIEGSAGWRAARAAPVEIVVPAAVADPEQVAAGLADYGVPVRVEAPALEEAALCT
ncbi:MAG TPA: hypothetical protein VE753_00450 [Gaiellaceae bacterium]|nr:hypothetical protein [Gaiellaceae bacterium]